MMDDETFDKYRRPDGTIDLYVLYIQEFKSTDRGTDYLFNIEGIHSIKSRQTAAVAIAMAQTLDAREGRGQRR